MDLNYSQEELAFRDEVRGWLSANLPQDLRDKMASYAELTREDLLRWHRILARKGWVAPAWPREWGGTGWNVVQRYIFEEECGYAGTPPIVSFGIHMCGPVLIRFGTEAQKKRFLPRMYNGDDFWCQGYSEPGSGSDLASLKTKAERRGDHYVVNGQKIWTTLGHYADWIFCLVRTDANMAKKQEGISFLLIDMKTPGITVRPLILMDGGHEVNEVFFDDVKVPKENLVGPLNGGWTIAKRLLQHERTNISGGGSLARLMGQSLGDIAKKYQPTGADGELADAVLRDKIADFEIRWNSFLLTARRAMEESKAAGGVSEISSVLKKLGTKLSQERSELLIEIRGLQGLGWEGDGFSDGELEAVRAWLFGKATTIYGGSTEIQNNIIAKRVLGMLDHQ